MGGLGGWIDGWMGLELGLGMDGWLVVGLGMDE